MNEWLVVSVIIALVGLFFTVGKPIINLNSNIVLLNANVKQNTEELKEQKEELKKQQEKAHESHEKLWKHNDKQDGILSDHETRLKVIEKSKEGY